MCAEHSQFQAFRLISILRHNVVNISGITRAGDRRLFRPPVTPPWDREFRRTSSLLFSAGATIALFSLRYTARNNREWIWIRRTLVPPLLVPRRPLLLFNPYETSNWLCRLDFPRARRQDPPLLPTTLVFLFLNAIHKFMMYTAVVYPRCTAVCSSRPDSPDVATVCWLHAEQINWPLMSHPLPRRDNAAQAPKHA